MGWPRRDAEGIGSPTLDGLIGNGERKRARPGSGRARWGYREEVLFTLFEVGQNEGGDEEAEGAEKETPEETAAGASFEAAEGDG